MSNRPTPPRAGTDHASFDEDRRTAARHATTRWNEQRSRRAPDARSFAAYQWRLRRCVQELELQLLWSNGQHLVAERREQRAAIIAPSAYPSPEHYAADAVRLHDDLTHAAQDHHAPMAVVRPTDDDATSEVVIDFVDPPDPRTRPVGVDSSASL